MKNTTLDILGCCVLRDTFSLHEGDGGYVIKKYVQIPSPVSVVTKSPRYQIGEEIKVIFLREKLTSSKNVKYLN